MSPQSGVQVADTCSACAPYCERGTGTLSTSVYKKSSVGCDIFVDISIRHCDFINECSSGKFAFDIDTPASQETFVNFSVYNTVQN